METVRFKKISICLAVLLSVCLVFSCFGTSVFTAKAESDANTVQEYTFEAEDLDYTGVGSISEMAYSDANCGGNTFVRLDNSTAGAGDYAEFTLNNISAGSYRFYTWCRSTGSRSVFELKVNGSVAGSIDFASDYGYNAIDGGIITVEKTGDVTIRLTITTARTTGFFIDKLCLAATDMELSIFKSRTIQDYKDNMQLTWSDEFDGDSLNMDNWSYEKSTTHRNEQFCEYNDSTENNENVQVKDGTLILTAKNEEIQCGHANDEDPDHDTTFNYSVGGIRSQNKQEYNGGIIETRVKAPTGSGLWCSVWMCGVDPTDNLPHWPWTGEIDIIEFVGKQTNQQFSSLRYQNPNSTAMNRKSAGGNKYTLSSGSFDSDYHTIGMFWTESYVSFYVDDYVYQTIDITADEFYAFRDYDFYFIVTFPVGGSMAGDITATFPQSFYVDYIRVYQSYKSEL